MKTACLKQVCPKRPATRSIRQFTARPVRRDDLPFWMEIYKDQAVLTQLYSAPIESKRSLWGYLHCEKCAFTVLGVDQRVGGFLLSQIAPCIGTFSFVIHKDFRGQGFSGPVMRLVEDEARKAGFRTLRADVYSDNQRSIRALECCGFRQFTWLEKNIV